VGDFERDTAVRERGDGVLDCEIAPDWWVVAGPNGGYLAAILVRALEAGAGADSRPLRSLTAHYLRAPGVGPARVEVDVERQGRSVSFVRARLVQDDRPCVSGVAVLADARPGLELEHARAPDVAPPEQTPAPPARADSPPFAEQFEFRHAVGAPVFGAADEALTGGWLRLRRERPLDAALLVALCDSWFPAVFTLSAEPPAVPTLELTVHLRTDGAPLPADWVLGRYATRTARDGFLEEDAEIYSRDGRLLAQSRQLALSL
jgi:acyl-CoA thioesterase